MNLNWDAISAIGQCLGAIATFLAVVVALKQSRPKIIVKAKICNIYSSDLKPTILRTDQLVITAVNVGNIPVQITSMGLKLPRRSKQDIYIVPQPNTIPKVLMPSEEVSIWTDIKAYRSRGIKDFNFACAYDSASRVYYCKTPLSRRIQRRFWWKFCKY